MNIISCSNYIEMSLRASSSVLAELKSNPGQLLCTATGSSPLGLYQNLSAAFKKEPEVFSALRILMLDEWLGLASDDLNSCNTFLQKQLIKPLAISETRYFTFKSDAPEPEKECERMDTIIRQEGPIDICILGLGKNGHLGFNEPAPELKSHCHVANLSDTSQEHSMISSMDTPPEFGLTLGMKDILGSKKIILLLTGASKRNVIEKFLSKNITTQLPASYLWGHPNVECYLDRSSMAV